MAENKESNSTAAGSSGGFKMNKKWGAIAMILSATGMGFVPFFSRAATAPAEAGGLLGFLGSGEVWSAWKSAAISGGADVVGDSIGAFMATGRMTLAFLFFTALVIGTGKLGLLKKTKLTAPIALGGLMIGLSLACYVTSTLMTTVANAVFLIYVGPVICTVLARIFRKEAMSIFQWVCLGAVFIGMVLTIDIVSFGPDGISFGVQLGAVEGMPNKPLGDAFGLLSGLFYGLAMFFYGYNRECDSAVRGVYNFLFAALGAGTLCLILNFTLAPLNLSAMDAQNWGWAIGFWAVCGPFALGLLLVAGKNLPAIDYSTIAYWECVVAPAVGLLIYKEAITPVVLIGGILIVLGGFAPIVAMIISSKKNKQLEESIEHLAEAEKEAMM